MFGQPKPLGSLLVPEVADEPVPLSLQAALIDHDAHTEHGHFLRLQDREHTGLQQLHGFLFTAGVAEVLKDQTEREHRLFQNLSSLNLFLLQMQKACKFSVNLESLEQDGLKVFSQ